MKTEEMKNPETRVDFACEDVEIDFEKDGEKIAGGDATPARVRIVYTALPPAVAGSGDATPARASGNFISFQLPIPRHGDDTRTRASGNLCKKAPEPELNSDIA